MTGGERAWQRSYLAIAGAAFAGYAILAGLLGPKASFPVAQIVNASMFRELTGIPVELLRAGCAGIIGVSLTEAFVVESARVHARTERLREEFISVVAHDLRGPLNAIQLLAARLQRTSAERPAEATQVLERIRDRIRALDRMIQDLLDSSRIEAKRLVLECRTIDLGKLVAEVVDRSALITKGHSIKLEVPDGGAHVQGDAIRLEQVLVNLLSNAAKYAYPDTAIGVKVSSERSEVLVSVTNSGPGVPTTAIPHLFDRFYRAGETRGTVPGIGLGLYLARGLIEAHGGHIWLEPQRGDRTTFCFALASVDPRTAS
jgi:signal transduction histidine kinase